MTKLLEVQKVALNASKGKRGYGYLMEMGLGKTLTGLTEATTMYSDEQTGAMVVLCPSSFRSGWEDELRKHDLDDYVDMLIFESGNDYWHNRWLEKRHPRKLPIVVINYEAIRSANTRQWLSDFMANKAAIIYADESTQLKTFDSQQTVAAIELSKEARYARIASGKWITEGPHDTWAQMRFMKQINGFNYYAYRTKYCLRGGFKGKQIIGFKDGTEESFGRMIAPHVFQATKAEWLDLLPKTYTTREYKLTNVLQNHYNTMLYDFVVWWNEEEAVTIEAAITKYIKLQQIQCGFIIDETGKPRQLARDCDNPRLQAVCNFMRNELSTKCCIVYHHRHCLGMLQEALKKYNPVHIAGGMNPDEVQKVKDTFNGKDDCRIILLQTRASKYGHTLLGGAGNNSCSTMLFFESTFSLDDRSQIEDRIHRIGQRGSATYVDLSGTDMDYKFAMALQRKEDIYQALKQAIDNAQRQLRKEYV